MEDMIKTTMDIAKQDSHNLCRRSKEDWEEFRNKKWINQEKLVDWLKIQRKDYSEVDPDTAHQTIKFIDTLLEQVKK